MRLTNSRYIKIGDNYYDRLTSTIKTCYDLKSDENYSSAISSAKKKYARSLYIHTKPSKITDILSKAYVYFSLIITIVLFPIYIRYNINIENLNIVLLVCTFIISLLASLFLHELSHAIIAHFQGAYVIEIGIKIREHYPRYYAKVLWNDKFSVCKKITFYLAGVATQLYLFNILYLVYLGTYYSCVFISAMLNLFFVIINLIPLKNSDGRNIAKLLIKQIRVKLK